MENNEIISHQISESPQAGEPRRRIFRDAMRRGKARTKAFFTRASGVFTAELRSNATPEKAAGSFAMGIFFGIFPIFGFQTIAAIFFAKLFKLNAPLAVLGTVVLIPLIIPIVFASVWLGSLMLPGAAQDMSALMDLFSENKSAFFAEGGKYFIAGCSSIAVLAGGLAYVIAYPICKMVKAKGKKHE